MTCRGPRQPIGGEPDAGFSLVEVLVALVILAIVATAALYFFVAGTRSSSHLQRTQTAVSVANEAMERVYGINPKDNISTGVVGLVMGRAKSDVNSAWTAMAALGADGVAETYPLWDGGVSNSTAAVLPLTYTTKVSGQTYSVTTLIGSCFRTTSVLAPDQPCQKISGVTADPGDAGTPTTKVRMLRVMTVVTWSPITTGECSGGSCSYSLSALVDRTNDLKWNQVIHPVAVDDFESFIVDAPQRTLSVLANDVVGPLGSSPVSILSGPTSGTLSTPTSAGLVNYTPPAGASGIFTFRYRVKDARGAQSDATATMTIVPGSTSDAGLKVLSGQDNSLAILSNDKGSKAGVTIVTPPTHGTLTVSGTSVTYRTNAGVLSGGDEFTYTYTDPSGQISPEATVSLLIDTVTIQDQTIDLLSSSSAVVDLRSLLVGTNTDPSTIRIQLSGAKPAQGILKLDGTTYTGTAIGPGNAITYTPPLNQVGEFTFQYQLSRVGGLTTLTKQVTLRVSPVAVADGSLSGVQVGSNKKLYDVKIGANDSPVNLGLVKVVTTALSSSCGTYSSSQPGLAAGNVRFETPANDGTCSFTYHLEGLGSLSYLKSADVPATFTY